MHWSFALIGGTSLSTIFGVLLYQKYMNRYTHQLSGGRHRNPQDIRRRRGDIPEIVTTGEIYRIRSESLPVIPED